MAAAIWKLEAEGRPKALATTELHQSHRGHAKINLETVKAPWLEGPETLPGVPLATIRDPLCNKTAVFASRSGSTPNTAPKSLSAEATRAEPEGYVGKDGIRIEGVEACEQLQTLRKQVSDLFVIAQNRRAANRSQET